MTFSHRFGHATGAIRDPKKSTYESSYITDWDRLYTWSDLVGWLSWVKDTLGDWDTPQEPADFDNKCLVEAPGVELAFWLSMFEAVKFPSSITRQDIHLSGDVFGFGALGLLKEPAFAVFALCSFLIAIPLVFYYNSANLYLVETDRPSPTALQTLGQISEVFFMAAMPFFIRLLGIKRMLMFGMLAWVLRYVCFASLNFSLVLFGLVLHGICYDFFFVASFIYVDKKAPSEMRASADRDLRALFPTIDEDQDGNVTRAEWRRAQAHNWSAIWLWPTVMAAITLVIFWLGFHDKAAEQASKDNAVA